MAVERLSFGSVSLVRQGDHRFYSLTLPSDVLGETCFVITREEDPAEGFQRELDKKRALEIASYIDSGLGTIPSSIVLSAQQSIDLQYDSRGKTISFKKSNKAFLIIDGQHRVYGFRLAKSALRIPVIIYDGLSKRDESRLFIDINSKQKGVRPELLLDIKRLAEYESDTEGFLRDLFDMFKDDTESILLGKLSSASKKKSFISRSTFNQAMKPLIKLFAAKPVDEVYEVMNNYLVAFEGSVLRPAGIDAQFTNLILFRAICGFFPNCAARVKNRFGPIYTVDNFADILCVLGSRIKPAKLTGSGQAYLPIIDYLEDSLKQDFSL